MDEHKDKKNIKQKAAAIAASAGVLLGGIFTSPADLPQDIMDRVPPPPAIQLVIPDLPQDDDDAALPEEEKKKNNKRSLSLFPRLLISAGLSLFVCLGFWLLYGIISPMLGPVVRIIVRTIFIAVSALFIYAALAKAILPGVPLKKILNWKVLLAVVLGSCALSYGIKLIFTSLSIHK